MPELPEVHTTVEGLKRVIVGKTITDVWSDFHIGTAHGERQTIKNKKYFNKFKKLVKGAKIKSVERKGKNILINLTKDQIFGYTIVIHMKMTGHLMVGKYRKIASPPTPSPKERGFKKRSGVLSEFPSPWGRGKGRGFWIPLEKGPLQDPYNKFIHLVFSLSNGPSMNSRQASHLVLSDMRKFASVTISKTEQLHEHDTIGSLGIDPFDKTLTSKNFYEILHAKKNTPIKSAMLDQSAISGIGNIYSDEILWQTGIHPLSPSSKIPKNKMDEIFKAMKTILKLSIKHGGDSKSDYRNIFGKKGSFQNFHKVYSLKNQKCSKPKCGGIISRMIIKGRSAHFCPKHQKLFK